VRRVLASIVSCVALFGACRTYDVTYTDTATCDAGSTSSVTCNGVPCIDLTTDRSNCGACGTTCAPDEICVESACTACPSATPTACPPLGTPGAGFCTNTSSDNDNCGACSEGEPPDHACTQGQICQDGVCGCPLQTCDGACVDTQNDVAHCGGCDSPCPSPGPGETAICTKGQCGVECIAPLADCDGIGANGCEANLQTDSDDCGACGRACTNGGTCTSGECPIVTYASATELAGLAVDATNVYFVDQSSPGIEESPIANPAISVLEADPQATALAVDSGRIVWLHVNDEIDSMPLSGTTVTQLALTSGIQTLTASAGFAYFSTGAAVERVPSDGSAQPTKICSASDAISLAVDDTNVYFVENTGTIRYAPIAQQNVSATLFGVYEALAVAIDTNNVYWVDTNGNVASRPKTGSQQPTTLATSVSLASNLVTDGVSLYWGDASNASAVHRMSTLGGAVKTLATTAGPARVLALDATSVYWTTDTSVAATTK